MIEPVGGHGGMNYYDFGLCQGLSRSGADVTLYTSDKTSREGTESYKIHLCYKRIFGPDPAWIRGIRYLRGSIHALLSARILGARIAHFHCFHFGPLEFFNLWLARLLRLRVVITAHEVQSPVPHLSVPWMAKNAYRSSAEIIAQSKIIKRELIEVLQVPETKVTVIPHGNYLPSVRQLPSQREAKAWVGIPKDARVLLFFGQIKEVKGLDVLLDAMPQIVAKYPNTILLIAGKVWKDNFQIYRKQLDSLGVANNCVSHIGYIPDSEVPCYFGAADVVVLPYRKISQSGVLLMAMSYGKPVVTSDIEGMTEVVSDGINGYLFSCGDAESLADKLVEVLASPEKLRAVGQNSIAYVAEHHDWDEIGRKTVALYESMLNDRDCEK